MRQLKLISLGAAALLLAVACSQEPEPPKNNPPVSVNPAPAAPPAPPTQPAANSFDPQAFYAQECVRCHGQDGKGLPKYKGKQPDFTNAQWQAKESEEELVEKVLNGDKPMPAFKDKLTEEQARLIIREVVRKFASQ